MKKLEVLLLPVDGNGRSFLQRWTIPVVNNAMASAKKASAEEEEEATGTATGAGNFETENKFLTMPANISSTEGAVAGTGAGTGAG